MPVPTSSDASAVMDPGFSAAPSPGMTQRVTSLSRESNVRAVADPRHPPVIGGKNATSAAPASGVSGLAWTRSTAARTTPSVSKA